MEMVPSEENQFVPKEVRITQTQPGSENQPQGGDLAVTLADRVYLGLPALGTHLWVCDLGLEFRG